MDLNSFIINDVETIIDKVFTSPKKFHYIEEAYQKLTQGIYEECYEQSGACPINVYVLAKNRSITRRLRDATLKK